VTGKYWATDCNDVIINGSTPPPPPPDTVRVSFVQSGQRELLTTVTAETDYSFAVDVTIPASARDGKATIEATGKVSLTQSAPLTVTATPPAPAQPELPFTGPRADLALLAVIGLAGVAAGLALARVRRTST